ncbi:MAG: peptidoglycan-binding protein [Clostridia bacterium]|nr:peptidoglycan-binding protein [Clostridia bacterium]
MPDSFVIPESITVHLGPPRSNAENVTLSFPDYIKNVASSEIYPTWPESAIRANIYAQISFALNRVFTGFYRAQGYDFDITNSTATDQSFAYGRDIFENISRIVDEIFNSYLRRPGNLEPLFAAYCDGIEVTCAGLSQWGSVDLANEGRTPYEILTYYYGDNLELVSDVPVADISGLVPEFPLREGSTGRDVAQLQVRLNRVATNYPAIPKIYPPDAIFGPETTEAVRAFQRIFNLTEDGIVGSATWYRLQYIYNAVKRISEINSEGITLEETTPQYTGELSLGDRGFTVRTLQYFLSYIATFVATVPTIAVDGVYGNATQAAVSAFQQAYGLPVTGSVNERTWDRIYNVYLGLVSSIPVVFTEGTTIPFPGVILRRGSQGDAVRVLQQYINGIAAVFSEIPPLSVDGVFGAGTEASVIAFQEAFGLSGTPGVVGAVLWDAIASVYEDLYTGNLASEGQYPGYTVS